MIGLNWPRKTGSGGLLHFENGFIGTNGKKYKQNIIKKIKLYFFRKLKIYFFNHKKY